jgi:hypothetical protein
MNNFAALNNYSVSKKNTFIKRCRIVRTEVGYSALFLLLKANVLPYSLSYFAFLPVKSKLEIPTNNLQVEAQRRRIVSL